MTGRGIHVILSLIVAVGVAATAGFAADGGRESPFSIGAGARAIGMGGGYTALSGDPYAIYYDPAALADLEFQEFSFSHTVLFERTAYDVAAWVYPITEHHGLGVGFMRLGTGDLVRRVDYVERGSFDFTQSQMLLSYGRNFGSRFAAGVSLKILYQSLAEYSDFGIGADAALTARLVGNLNLGLIARDLMQAEMELREVVERTPRSFMLGLAWRDLAVAERFRVTASCDLEKHSDKDVKLHAGAEATLYDLFLARVGYDRDNVAFGVGLRHGRLSFDYAYKLTDYLADVHHFTVSFKLGISVPERIRRRELAKLPPEPTEEEKRLAQLTDSANYYFRRFQLDSATFYFRRALAMDPQNEEIIGTLAAIEEARRVQREQEAALQSAQDDYAQTMSSFLSQAEALLASRNYRAAEDLLGLIFDVDSENPGARAVQERIESTRAAEIVEKFDTARRAVEAGRLMDAVDAYNRILEIDPENAGARQSREQVLSTIDIPERVRTAVDMFNQGQLDDARRRFESILEVSPQEPVARDYLQRIKEAQRRPATFEDLQKDPVHWELYLEGLRHMRNKDYRKAIEAWEKVLEAYPNNPNTLNNLQQARLRLGEQTPEQ